MADISLRDYLAKLDSLLERGNPTEVIHHCRHILQYYPKNAEAYRLLGRALVYNKSWKEAGDVLRRVLSVYPDDYSAHAGLSEVYLAEKRADDAIWHLERAFEQQPNNQAVLDALRELYRKFRRQEHAKVQLTAGAVARQYIRNGLYEQAIEALKGTFERSPERLDVLLLLAHTYRDAGYPLESAETALKVLKTLPDCLEANRILAELWLKEDRPSDAQRYINRIQSVEPYLALSLAQGEAVSDESFKLEELDYRSVAEREIVTRAPDWLQEVNQSGEEAVAGDELDWMAPAAPAAEDDDDEFPSTDFSSDLPDDWLADLENAPPPQPAPTDDDIFADDGTPRRRTGLTGLLATLDTPSGVVEEPDNSDFDALFMPATDDLFPPEAEVEAPALDDLFPAEPAPAAVPPVSMDDLFADMEPAPDTKRQTGAVKETDPLAWLKESGIELVDEPLPESDVDLFGAEEDNLALQDASAADPLAWLKGSGGSDMIVEDSAPANFMVDDELPPAAPTDDDDPLAWLKDSGVEMAKPSAPAPSSAAAVDPLDWLADESLLDEALSMEALIDNTGALPERPAANSVPASTPDWQDSMSDSNDDLDWLNDSSGTPSDASQPADDDFPDWLTEAQPAAAAEKPTPAATTDVPDWFSDMTEDEPEPAAEEIGVPDWLSDMQPVNSKGQTEPVAEEAGGFEWMSSAEEDEEPAEEAGVPDWLSDMQPEEPEAEPVAEEAGGFEWMSSTEEEEEPAEEVGVPDWLSEMQPEEPVAAAEPVVEEAGSFEWMSSTEEESAEEVGVPNWLSGMQPEEPAAEAEPVAEEAGGFEWMSSAEEDEEPAEEVGVPDWLSDMQPEEPEAEPVAEEAGGFEWMSSAGEDEEEPAEEVGVPDWLSDMQPEEPVAEAEPVAEEAGSFEWMSSAEEDEAEPAEEVGVPNWLSDMQPEETAAEAEPVAEEAGGFEWMSSAEEDEEPAEEAGVPDWLSEMQPEEPAAEPVAEEAGSFEWMGSAEEDEEPAEEVGVPDWLSEMQPEEPAAEAEPVAEEAGGFEWMSSTEEDEEESAEEAGVPNWLSEMQPEEPAAEAEPVAEEAGGFEWMSSAEEDEEPAEEAGVPDWMAAIQPEETAPAADSFRWETEPVAAADTPDWLSQLETEDEEEPVAEEAGVPDWLSEMQPDEPAAEPEPVRAAVDEIEWEAEAEVEAADMPDWLSEMQPEETTAEPEPAVAHDDFQWGEEAEAEPAAETPDWLRSIQADETKSEPAMAAESDASSEFTWIDDINAESQVEFEAEPIEAELEESPVSNVPDWLNAMVPGLDVDFEASEDEQIESEFAAGSENRMMAVVPETPRNRTKRDFDWLVDIVDNETRPMTAVEEKSARRRFSFTRQPAWLRPPTEKPADPDDIDLPPWLQ